MTELLRIGSGLRSKTTADSLWRGKLGSVKAL